MEKSGNNGKVRGESREKTPNSSFSRKRESKNKVASGFDKGNFEYDDINDRYICPLGYELPFKWNGKQ